MLSLSSTTQSKRSRRSFNYRGRSSEGKEWEGQIFGRRRSFEQFSKMFSRTASSSRFLMMESTICYDGPILRIYRALMIRSCFLLTARPCFEAITNCYSLDHWLDLYPRRALHPTECCFSSLSFHDEERWDFLRDDNRFSYRWERLLEDERLDWWESRSEPSARLTSRTPSSCEV